MAVPASIDAKRAALVALCRKFDVYRLELFGSAAAGRFEEGKSNLDFLVTFTDDRVKGIARMYLGLAEELEQLLGHRVDLLTNESIRNPYLRQTIVATRRLIHEDRSERAAGFGTVTKIRSLGRYSSV
jgi:predicted nucleotidyltransferase